MGVATLPLILLVLVSLIQDPASSKKVELGEEFKIKSGEEVVVTGEKLRITFRSVLNDSRCPTGGVCVWAGNAQVGIEVAKKNKKQVVAMLNTYSEPKEIDYKGFLIELLALRPYPGGKPIDPKDYEATMVVTKEE
jgi:uncharacterized Zn finger protein